MLLSVRAHKLVELLEIFTLSYTTPILGQKVKFAQDHCVFKSAILLHVKKSMSEMLPMVAFANDFLRV